MNLCGKKSIELLKNCADVWGFVKWAASVIVDDSKIVPNAHAHAHAHTHTLYITKDKPGAFKSH